MGVGVLMAAVLSPEKILPKLTDLRHMLRAGLPSLQLQLISAVVAWFKFLMLLELQNLFPSLYSTMALPIVLKRNFWILSTKTLIFALARLSCKCKRKRLMIYSNAQNILKIMILLFLQGLGTSQTNLSADQHLWSFRTGYLSVGATKKSYPLMYYHVLANCFNKYFTFVYYWYANKLYWYF